MRKNTICIIIFVIIIMSAEYSFSQRIVFSGKNPAVTTDDYSNFTKKPETKHTKEGLKITDEMNRLKSDQTINGGERILELQKKLESIEHITVTKTYDATEQTFSDNTGQKINQIQTDAITLSSIYSTSNSFIKSIATQVEQTAPGLGTIWAAFAVGRLDSGIGATSDTVLLYKSTNNGLTYNLYSRLATTAGYKISNDEMDMEIIENSVQKFIYLTLGYTTNGYTGQYRNALIVYDIVNNTSASQILSFPGATASSKFYRPRITSDNVKYPSNSYVTISVIQDSTDGLNHFYMTKFCKIFNPYTTSPAITYLPQRIYLPLFYAPFSSTVYADIAYYDNGGTITSDSLLFVLSGYPGATQNIYLYKGDNNFAQYPNIAKILSENSHEKQFAKIASNGGVNQKKMLMVFVENYNEGGFDYSDLYTYETTDAKSWSKSQVAGAGDIFQVKNPDIIGQRNLSGRFFLAFKFDTPLMDVISSAAYNDLYITTLVFDHNNGLRKSYASPKPSFRLNNPDSCVTIWSSASSLYSSCGCSALNLNISFFIQGLYDTATVFSKYDIVTVYLRNSTAPYAKVDSAKGYNAGLYTFLHASPGTYYLSITHRNSIETWFYQPVTLSYSGSLGLDMYTLSSRAYGNNLIQVDNSPNVFAIFSGDINQDGLINLSDLILIFNNSANFINGYVVTDLTGDNVTNLADVLMCYNNSVKFVHLIRP